MNRKQAFPVRPDAVALLEQLRAGQISSEDLVKECLAKVEALQPSVNAATHIFKQEAIDLAQSLDQSGDKELPLFGLPCTIKETFGIAGEEITAGSIRMTPEQCTQDAEIVKRLKAAGAVVIARSNLPEFAMTGESTNLRFGRCNNPHDISRVAGGSSGGEGALVGSGASVFGVGSDILGSIRIPAAFCGTVGFKPHSGAIDKTGTWPVVTGNTSNWLALGPLTRSVRDARLIYNVVAQEPVANTAEAFKQQIIPQGFPIKYRQSCIEMAVDAARKALEGSGVPMKNEPFSDISKLFLMMTKIVIDDFYNDWIKGLSSPTAGKFSVIKECFSQLVGKPTIDRGLLNWILLRPIKKIRNNTARNKIVTSFSDAQKHYQNLLGDDRVIILPTLGLLAPKHKGFNRSSLLNPLVNGLITSHTLVNYLNLSAIAVPAWKFCDPKTGLPPSVSLICAPGSEAKLLAAAEIVETALNP